MTMKHLFKYAACAFLALAFCTFNLTAQLSRNAEYGEIGTLGSDGTGVNSTIVASSYTNGGYVLNCTKVDKFNLDVSFKLMAAGTTALDFAWDTSQDGTNWCTVLDGKQKGWFGGPAANGTTPVYWSTNIDIGMNGYYRIRYITNGSANVVTNLLIKAYTKTAR
jgi:hypothetical protein